MPQTLQDVTLQETAEKLNLRREGTTHNGETNYYCPQHDNTSADLYLNQNGTRFYCFGSGSHEGGKNPVTLVMHTKGYNKKQAIEWLVEQFNLQQEDIDEEEIQKYQDAEKALEKAAELCHGQLTQDTERLQKIKDERNLTEQVIQDVQIGYFNEQVDQTLQKRFTEQALINSGLYGEQKSGDGIYPILNNRITFPYTSHGTVKYFIGRRTQSQEQYWMQQAEKNKEELIEIMENPDTDAETLEEAKYKWMSKNCGKYIKIRQTQYNEHILWQKHEHRDTLIITEGIYDAICAYHAGYSTVSPVTTQFKESDIEKVVDQALHYENVYIAMDGDSAGKEGAQKTARRLAEQQLEPKIVKLDNGEDLDDYTNQNGYQLDELLNDAENYLDSLLDRFEDAGRMQETKLKHQVFDIIKDWEGTQRNAVLRDQRITGTKREKKKEYKEYTSNQKEKHNNTQNDTDVESEDRTVEDDSITEVLMVKDEEFGINPVTHIEVRQLDRTIQQTKRNNEGVIQPEPLKKVYTLKTGRGEEQNEVKLLTSPDKDLTLGDKKLPLKQADLMKEEYRSLQYFNDLYADETEGMDDPPSYRQWLRQQMEDNKFLEIADRLTKESKELIVEEISNQKLLDIVEHYLDYGYHKDSKLTSVMYPKMVKVDKTQVKPAQVMSYQPHTQLWTNTKVGKTYTADMVGLLKDDATPAGLLGFVNAEDGKQTGTIDNTAEPVFLDEVNYGSSSRQLNDKLLGIMEKGKTTQTKAGYNLETRYWGDITYMANPKNDSEEVSANDLVEKFEQTIEKLGDNIQAMASRFGVVVFDEGMDTASGQKIDAVQGERIETLFEYVKQEIAPIYTELLYEFEDWMETEYSEEYQDEVVNLSEEIISDKVSKFWKNHLESYRHARGQALKMAVYRNMGSLIKVYNDPNTDSSDLAEVIREDLDTAMEEVMQINRESLENMVDVSNSENVKSRSKAVLDGQNPRYLEAFMKNVSRYAAENSVDAGEYVAATQLKQCWNDNSEALGIDSGSHYSDWSNVVDAVQDNRVKYSDLLENRYGVRVVERSNVLMWKVANQARFEPFREAALDYSSEDTQETLTQDIDMSEETREVREVKKAVDKWKKDKRIDAEISVFDLQEKVNVDVEEDKVVEVVKSLSNDGYVMFDESSMKVMNL